MEIGYLIAVLALAVAGILNVFQIRRLRHRIAECKKRLRLLEDQLVWGNGGPRVPGLSRIDNRTGRPEFLFGPDSDPFKEHYK